MSALSVEWIVALAVSFRPSAKIVTNAMRARPIISAAAVTAVRPGLRVAFSLASTPGVPLRSAERPADHADDRRDEVAAQHRDGDEQSEAAEPDERQAGVVLPGFPSSP